MSERPDVYQFDRPEDFFRALSAFYKSSSRFSIRERTKRQTVSHSLVSQILKRKRKLKRDNLPSFKEIFELAEHEYEFIDTVLTHKNSRQVTTAKPLSPYLRQPKNHLFSKWLHAYVKDSIYLKGFTPDANHIYKLLNGIAKPKAIESSIQFLREHGFWRLNQKSEVVPNDEVVVSSNGIPSISIRNFHMAALKIAMRGLKEYSVNRRKAITHLISINEAQANELKQIMDEFQEKLIALSSENSKTDSLYQVVLHLTPIGGQNDKTD